MIQRLDRYTTARAQDLRESGDIGTFANNLRRMVSRFLNAISAARAIAKAITAS